MSIPKLNIKLLIYFVPVVGMIFVLSSPDRVLRRVVFPASSNPRQITSKVGSGLCGPPQHRRRKIYNYKSQTTM